MKLRLCRLNIELKELDDNDIYYNILEDIIIDNRIHNLTLELLTNYGIVKVYYPNEYPLKPQIFKINSNIFYYDNNLYIKYYLLCMNISNKPPFEIKINIFNKFISGLPNKMIDFKLFLKYLLNIRYLLDIDYYYNFDYDFIIWNSSIKLFDIINKFLELNKKSNIKKKNILHFL